MRIKILALAAVFSLAITGALGQVIIGGGGSGGGGGGTGNVVGPASSTDGAVALYDGTTGKLLKDGLAPSMTIGGASTPLGGTVTATTVLDSLGSTRGSVLYRGASGWTVLTPGTSGFFLKSNGAGADPSYASAAGSGTVTSLTGGNGILVGASSPCTTACTIDLTVTRNAQTGTTYATLSTDGGKLVSLSNASPVAVSLSQANTAGFTAGFGTDFNNIGAGLVTVTAATSTFDNGLSTLLVAKGQDAYVWSDGTNYHAAMSQPVAANNTVMGNVSGASNYPVALTATQLTALINPPTSTLSGAVPATGTPSGKFLKDDLTWAAPTVTPPCAGANADWVPQTGKWFWARKGILGTPVNIGTTTTYLVAKCFPTAQSITNVGFKITASNAGNLQIAVYGSDPTTGRPTGSVLCQTASQSTASTGILSPACAASVSAGWVWFAYQVDNATATIMSFSTQDNTNGYTFGASTQSSLSGNSTSTATSLTIAGTTFGTFPSSPTITETGITAIVEPAIQFKL